MTPATDEPESPQVVKEITELLEEEDRVTAPAPTISGGIVGSNMDGGGIIGDPEVPDDKQGNVGGGPIVLETTQEEEQINQHRFDLEEETAEQK